MLRISHSVRTFQGWWATDLLLMAMMSYARYLYKCFPVSLSSSTISSPSSSVWWWGKECLPFMGLTGKRICTAKVCNLLASREALRRDQLALHKDHSQTRVEQTARHQPPIGADTSRSRHLSCSSAKTYIQNHAGHAATCFCNYRLCTQRKRDSNSVVGQKTCR